MFVPPIKLVNNRHFNTFQFDFKHRVCRDVGIQAYTHTLGIHQMDFGYDICRSLMLLHVATMIKFPSVS